MDKIKVLPLESLDAKVTHSEMQILSGSDLLLPKAAIQRSLTENMAPIGSTISRDRRGKNELKLQTELNGIVNICIPIGK